VPVADTRRREVPVSRQRPAPLTRRQLSLHEARLLAAASTGLAQLRSPKARARAFRLAQMGLATTDAEGLRATAEGRVLLVRTDCYARFCNLDLGHRGPCECVLRSAAELRAKQAAIARVLATIAR
jgi:hypothetical protein